MISDVMDPHCVSDREPSTAPKSIPTEQSSPISLLSNQLCREMRLPALAAHCLREINHYRRGEPYMDTYAVELLRRATVEDDQEAWLWVHHCFGGLVQAWLHRHPKREAACRLESEATYVSQAFERFWQSTTANQRVEFGTLAAALQYLRASLHGAILDTLRAYARPREVALPEPGEPGEPHVEESTESSEVWEILKTMLPNPREQRGAYLLFYCGLKPREIVRLCPQEWSAVYEIYGLRRTIMERLLRNAEHLRWRLS
jgi:DNA-directed RNA polymerase specialized sigma24 family protein